MFLAFLLFDPNQLFFKGYSLYIGYSLGKMADFYNRFFSQIFGFFERFFAQNNFNVVVQSFLHVFCISFFTQTDYFVKAIGYP